MENITMNLIPLSWAALVPSADVIGDATGFIADRGRALTAGTQAPFGIKASFVVDPRPAGPVV